MSKVVKTFAGLSLAAGAVFGAGAGVAAVPAPFERNGTAPSADARFAADEVARTGDNGRRPFAIVDKKAARLHLFDADFRPVGDSPVLIGLARGDDPAPRTHLPLRPADRTTPAGRYASEPGHNDHGEAIVWIDYGASLAIHRLRPAPARERRPERMASPRADDKRISLGCVVVPVAFYEGVVAPLLGRRRGVVYVLPESRPVETLFAAPTALASR